MTYPLLRLIKDDADRPHSIPSVTSLNGCLRKSWILHTHDYHEYPSSRIALLFGTWLHGMLETSNGAGIPELAVKWTTPDGFEVHGTADYYVPETKTLMDWKSAASLWINRLPYDHHEVQINLYAFLLAHNKLEPRVPVENLEMVYISKTGPDKKKNTHNGVVRKPVERWTGDRARNYIIKRTWALMSAINGELVLEKARQKWWCNYCPVVSICDQLPLP